jgi:hypothetical protein
MLLPDGICTLADMVIIDPTQKYLISHVLFCEVVTMVVAQAKKGIYYN